MSNETKATYFRTWQRLALGSLLSLSAASCADTGSEGEAGFPTGEDPVAGSDQPAPTDAAGDQALPGVRAASNVLKIPRGADVREIKRWFVELEGVPLIEGGDYQALDEGVDAFRKNAFEAGLKVREHMRFDGLIHGISVSLHHTELAKLSTLRGVKAVYPVGKSRVPKAVHSSVSPEMQTALAMTGADVAHDTLNAKGTGIRVGVIDTGIDVDHPDFRVGGTAAGQLRIDLSRSYDFVGDDYTGDNDPVPDADPDDCAGHGTHVAGILGASGNPATGGVVGVAPGVTLQGYRVFGCDGSAGNDVIVAAMERAYNDGADVINLSLGSDNGWAEEFFAVALSRMLSLGVVPVASAGNNGANGTWTVGSPGVGEDVVTVAAVDNVKLHFESLKLADGTEVAYANLDGSPLAPTTGTIGPVVYVGQGCPANEAEGRPDEDPYLADPTDKVALITRGVCFFTEKYLRAQAAGAKAVIIEQNRNEPPFPGSLAPVPPAETIDANIPAIMISQADGTKLKALIEANNSTITWTAESAELDNPTGNMISDFSSWGLSPELLLKPDIAAPGGSIRSTYPLPEDGSAGTGYATMGGTSMSSPYVAGAVALMLEKNPGIALSRIRAILQNTAEPSPASLEEGSPIDAAHHQGAGFLRIDRALQTKTVVTPSKLSTGEGERGPFEAQLYVENLSDQEATYTLSVIDALASWGNAIDWNVGPHPYRAVAPAKVRFEALVGSDFEEVTTLTVPARTVRTLSVTITAPTHLPLEEGETEPFELPDGAIYSGFIKLTPQQGAQATAVSVPYAGVVGDYQAIEHISYPVFGLDQPMVMVKDPGVLGDLLNVELAPENVAAPYHVYSMKEDDLPTAVIQLAHGVSKVTGHLVPHGDFGWVGAIKAFEYPAYGRNNMFESFFNTPFTASEYGANKVPDGVYHMRLTLVKALGDAHNPDHVTVLESTPFKIDRTAEPPPPPEDEDD